MELNYSNDYEAFEYEVDNDDVFWALGDILFENYFDTKIIKGKELKETIKKGIRFMISDMDGSVVNNLRENLEKEFSDELEAYFEDDAWDAHKRDDFGVGL